jgi:hypothetical protein
MTDFFNNTGRRSGDSELRSIMCARHGHVADKTIDRWAADGILPTPLLINRRRPWAVFRLIKRLETELAWRDRAKHTDPRPSADQPPTEPNGGNPWALEEKTTATVSRHI